MKTPQVPPFTDAKSRFETCEQEARKRRAFIEKYGVTGGTMESRRQTEIEETALTLIEDRGRGNALAWAEHCMRRDPSDGFWRAVADAIKQDAFAGRWHR